MKQLAYAVWVAVLLLASAFVLAQDDGVVTDDMVRDIAEHMYCPICENEPLDDCRNPTCIQWKQEIREQLVEGRDEDEIVEYFIVRYGEQVVGVPRDPFLRSFSFAAPIVGTLLALIFAAMTFSRWQRNQQRQPAPAPTPHTPSDDDDYRQRLEQDLM